MHLPKDVLNKKAVTLRKDEAPLPPGSDFHGVNGAVPTVSVIIPTYRRRQYLVGAVTSALAQSYRDLEVIVTDNDSEGRLPPELADLADPRLRYRRNTTNLGMLGNLLAAVQEAQGRYLATLHDDDLWEPKLLETLVPQLEADSTLAVAFADHYVIDHEGRIDVARTDEVTRSSGRGRLARGRHVAIAKLTILDGSIPIVLAAVLRKSAIEWDYFPEEVVSAYDLWLAYLAYRSGGAAYYHPERLARYRSHWGAETQGNRIGHEEAAAYCHNRFILDETLKPLRRQLKVRYANHKVGAATAMLREGRVVEARSSLRRALRRNPSPRTNVALLVSLLPPAMARRTTLVLVALKRRLTAVNR